MLRTAELAELGGFTVSIFTIFSLPQKPTATVKTPSPAIFRDCHASIRATVAQQIELSCWFIQTAFTHTHTQSTELKASFENTSGRVQRKIFQQKF